jgi:hypothetical protein
LQDTRVNLRQSDYTQVPQLSIGENIDLEQPLMLWERGFEGFKNVDKKTKSLQYCTVSTWPTLRLFLTRLKTWNAGTGRRIDCDLQTAALSFSDLILFSYPATTSCSLSRLHFLQLHFPRLLASYFFLYLDLKIFLRRSPFPFNSTYCTFWFRIIRTNICVHYHMNPLNGTVILESGTVTTSDSD